jgi:formylglycine-generating enzyme
MSKTTKRVAAVVVLGVSLAGCGGDTERSPGDEAGQGGTTAADQGGAAGNAEPGTGGTAGASGSNPEGGATAVEGGSANGGTVAGGNAGAAAGGSAGASGGAGTGGSSGTASGGEGTGGGVVTDCPGTGGPVMKRLPEGYCIDTTEVSNAQYKAWLDTNPDPSAQDLENCGWNEAFMHDYPQLITLYPNHPMNADWCDAKAYCEAVGKRLCRGIDNVTVVFDAEPSIAEEWYNACTGHGDSIWIGSCNVSTRSLRRSPMDVGTFPSCQPSAEGYEGVFDLVGNVGEWVDQCDGPGQDGQCWVRGGHAEAGYYEWDTTPTCDYVQSIRRNEPTNGVGFRCCAD